VPEAEPALFAGNEHLLGDRLAQGAVQRLVLDPGYLGDRRLSQRPPHRDRPYSALCVRRQALDAQQESVPEALRRGAAPVEAGGEQLLDVERVAFTAGEQAIDQLHAGSIAEDVLQRLRQLGAIERSQLDSARALEALELCEERAQRVAAVKLVGAVGEQQHHALLSQAAGQEGHERACRAVRPVHVLEDQHERLGPPSSSRPGSRADRAERLARPSAARAGC
jgi:hypothetical protein